jgi:hypothetical protein
MKKIIMVMGVILLLNATFAAKPKTKNIKKKEDCIQALYTQSDNCGQILSTVVECCGSCNPNPGGNMYQAGLNWVNANYYINANGCFTPR